MKALWATAIISIALVSAAGAETPTNIPAPLVVELSGTRLTIAPSLQDDGPAAIVSSGHDSFTVPVGRLDVSTDFPNLALMTKVFRDYLFIETDDRSTAWRSDRLNVFAIRAGRLVHLGDVVAEQPHLNTGTGPAGLDGRFVDIDDQLETNEVTLHIDAPRVWVFLKENHSKLVYNPTLCWPANAPTYDDAARSVRPDLWKLPEQAAATVLQMLVIDKYCGHHDALVADMSVSRAGLAHPLYEKVIAALRKMQVGKRPTY